MFILRNIPTREAIEAFARHVPEVDPSAAESSLLLLRVASDLLDAFETHFARHGLSMGRFGILMYLFRAPKHCLSPADLANRAGVTRAPVTGLLDGLARQGLVEGRPHEAGRRKVNVLLTPKGLGLLKGLFPEHFGRIAGLMRHLSEAERKSLIRLLGKVLAGIPAVRDA